MRLQTIVDGDTAQLARRLRKQLADHVRADYTYMYPPRQTYGPVASDDLTAAVGRSLANSVGGPLNLYLHFPFCEQICGFCNLFAVASRDTDLIDTYITTLLRELDAYAPLVSGHTLDTLYLGGGTPSLISPAQLARLFEGIERRLGTDIAAIPEVAMEVSPSTVEPAKFREFHRLGINRVNLGFQSLADTELAAIGRDYTSATPLRALTEVMEVGFGNVCVDLIYGLPGQDHASWRHSVDTVIGHAPQTVCAYALTLRPRTGFDLRGYHSIDGADQYAKYDYVDERLREAGYRQQTHVRWARGPSGGYRQKANHWGLQPLVGLGAGARGYLWECDYRNGYSVRHRMRVLRDYLEAVPRHTHGRTDGFLMDDDERRRKAVILGLTDLDPDWYRKTFDATPEDHFGPQLATLHRMGLLESTPDRLRLTRLGLRHRDVIVQHFFSGQVRDRLLAFDYDE
ncbi:coproporphyrinogen-III oxidase family protein [Streptomyces sp. NPDC006422]|uniref:coproporphyrinogen-III oxidase family protein n=1 Tax=unclassified Streptomyces TaxID=2593676 RepID=UPI0033A9780C